ncbi:MAG: UvrD-helicase domain-containing protein [Rhodothermales bacterium]|nr:UvrD-helicase domain-containing protein [Rhodothermales bacterium]
MGRKLEKKPQAGQFDLFAVPPEAASEETKVLVDASARSTIANVLDQNVVVLAGAGAGKTHELIGRMVACIVSGRAEVTQLAAITFTRKAAGEMKNRFAGRLRKALEEAHESSDSNTASTESEADRLQVALENVDQCFIGTIHAFCARLLRERPLEADLSPDFTELDERQEAAIQREAWQAFVENFFSREDPKMQAFRETGLALEDLFPFFQTRVQYSEVALKPAHVERPDMAEAVSVARTFVEHVAPELPDTSDPDAATIAIRRAAAFIANRRVRNVIDEVDLLQLLQRGLAKKGSVVFNRWGGKDKFARKLRDELRPSLLQYLEPVIEQWREYIYSVAAPLIDSACDFYRAYRRERSYVTFQDLLEITVSMLKSNPSTRRFFQERIRTLFVDEFQDTDPLQAEMLLLLMGDDIHETDWRRAQPRPGSLFIVGDEKQSIYRFRRADIDVFRKVVSIIGANGGTVVELTSSFRSLGNLCRQINRVYSGLFEKSEARHQASYAPLSPVLADGTDPLCVRRLTGPAKGKLEEKARAESERIADFIQAAIEGRTDLNGSEPASVLPEFASPGSFMLIARQRRRLSIYAAALECRGIPYDLTGGDSLGALPELRTLVDFLEVLLYPDDSVRYFGYLRGPLVGLSDTDLYALRQNGGRFLLGSGLLPDEIDDDLRLRVTNARARLLLAEDDLRMLPAGAAIERIVDRLGLLPFAASRSEGSYRAGSLFRVLSFVRMWDAEGLGWVDIVKEFNDLIADDVKAIEGMTMDVGRSDVVRILNLHQAKGLEADVVFLVDAANAERATNRNEVHLTRLNDEPHVSIPVSRTFGKGKVVLGYPPGWSDDDAEEALYQAAEQTRLSYVAATRAARLLIVGQNDASVRRKCIWDDVGSGFDNAPELKIPEPLESKPPDFDPVPLAIKISERQQQHSAARLESYALKRVAEHDEHFASRGTATDDTIDGSTSSSRSSTELDEAGASRQYTFTRGGRGMEFGRIVHKIFEHVVENRFPDNDEYFDSVFDGFVGSESARAGAIAAARTAVDNFVQSDTFRNLANASQVHAEVPFGSFVADGLDPELSVITSGVIDLVYCLNGQWHIVDYKTDGAADEAEVKILVERYSDQIRTYASEWASIVGQPVESAGLWVVARSEFVAVPLDR